MSIEIPNIPGPFTSPPVVFAKLKEAIDVMAGRIGTPMNKVVTHQDLVDMEIPGIIISAAEPDDPFAGMVWLDVS